MTTVQQRWDSEYQVRNVARAEGTDADAVNAALAFFGDVRGKRILDVGCGTGMATVPFAEAGARVVSIDLSPVAISNLQAYCDAAGLNEVTPVLMKADEIGGLGSFDFVYGAMILHHIEPFPSFAALLRRSLAPHGRAFFYENSAMSRVLVWFRTHVVGKLWVPKRGDDEEFPLTPGEVDALRHHFDVRVEYPELMFYRLISDYLLRGRFGAPFAALDSWAYRFPRIRRYSYRQYLYLSAKPDRQ